MDSKYFFNFIHIFGEDFHIDEYFSNGLKPPTSVGIGLFSRSITCHLWWICQGSFTEESLDLTPTPPKIRNTPQNRPYNKPNSQAKNPQEWREVNSLDKGKVIKFLKKKKKNSSLGNSCVINVPADWFNHRKKTWNRKDRLVWQRVCFGFGVMFRFHMILLRGVS